ncbi:plasmid mobilization relaxosome protein MobC [Streptomyces sp. UNOC14_S4]|uniref:plasmid mobilization relaxosome protein MobC n=1 Tax=Streptomyces sp. UNOC14_S4 TaxID=2872340 RepID=UPI001E5EA6B8|nr:plasmid mobilization relaxosome protein MobC [Streptomyces sp. UNOC14_S4]MCC3767986.1 MobC family plasmid mobilization relaxosome protein [Streptomyces sp. UNOC14_S4]
MHDQHHKLAIDQLEMATTSAQSAARYPAGPSNGRSHGDASAPGVAEVLGHQGVPEEEKPVGYSEPSLPRAADEAALYRVARRRQRQTVQRKERVDVRYSVVEKNTIVTRARSMNIAAAHLVGAVIMAYLEGNLALPGQRTATDDLIDELNALRTQVAHIGRNVNQIARVLNSGANSHPVDAAVLAAATRTLDIVRAAVTDIDVGSYRAATAKAAA